jgi:hypothetical protein
MIKITPGKSSPESYEFLGTYTFYPELTVANYNGPFADWRLRAMSKESVGRLARCIQELTGKAIISDWYSAERNVFGAKALNAPLSHEALDPTDCMFFFYIEDTPILFELMGREHDHMALRVRIPTREHGIAFEERKKETLQLLQEMEKWLSVGADRNP